MVARQLHALQRMRADLVALEQRNKIFNTDAAAFRSVRPPVRSSGALDRSVRRTSSAAAASRRVASPRARARARGKRLRRYELRTECGIGAPAPDAAAAAEDAVLAHARADDEDGAVRPIQRKSLWCVSAWGHPGYADACIGVGSALRQALETQLPELMARVVVNEVAHAGDRVARAFQASMLRQVRTSWDACGYSRNDVLGCMWVLT